MHYWTASELFYMINHIRVLGERGVKQVANRLALSTSEVRREWERQLEVLKGGSE